MKFIIGTSIKVMQVCFFVKYDELEIWGRAQPPTGRDIVCRKIQFGWVNMQVYNFFVCGPKFTIIFSPNVGGVVVDQVFFRFSMWICSGDIREQTGKLSEIAMNFRRFLPSQILGGGPSPKIVHT